MADTNVHTRTATVACPFCSQLNRVSLDRVADRPKCGECGRPLLLDRPLAVTDAAFDRVISDTQVPVLVDFYADWCQPCKVMAPLLDELARRHTGELLVLKLDTDRSPAVSQRFGIRGIPTLILFRDGQERAREVGAVPRSRLDALVARAAREQSGAS
ncbi:MAG TPA: thioredoxin [Longimicrobiales bacterium]|nr:thioredoxin [Longimicrobiales bacterium]